MQYYRLVDVFPELADAMKRDFKRARRADLVKSIEDFEIVDRCPCGWHGWGTFYGVSAERRRAITTVALELPCGVNVDEARGQIIAIETFDPEVPAVLNGLIP